LRADAAHADMARGLLKMIMMQSPATPDASAAEKPASVDLPTDIEGPLGSILTSLAEVSKSVEQLVEDYDALNSQLVAVGVDATKQVETVKRLPIPQDQIDQTVAELTSIPIEISQHRLNLSVIASNIAAVLTGMRQAIDSGAQVKEPEKQRLQSPATSNLTLYSAPQDQLYQYRQRIIEIQEQIYTMFGSLNEAVKKAGEQKTDNAGKKDEKLAAKKSNEEKIKSTSSDKESLENSDAKILPAVSAAIKAAQAEIDKLEAANKQIDAENAQLEAQNEKMKDMLGNIRDAVIVLTTVVEGLKTNIDHSNRSLEPQKPVQPAAASKPASIPEPAPASTPNPAAKPAGGPPPLPQTSAAAGQAAAKQPAVAFETILERAFKPEDKIRNGLQRAINEKNVEIIKKALIFYYETALRSQTIGTFSLDGNFKDMSSVIITDHVQGWNVTVDQIFDAIKVKIAFAAFDGLKKYIDSLPDDSLDVGPNKEKVNEVAVILRMVQEWLKKQRFGGNLTGSDVFNGEEGRDFVAEMLHMQEKEGLIAKDFRWAILGFISEKVGTAMGLFNQNDIESKTLESASKGLGMATVI